MSQKGAGRKIVQDDNIDKKIGRNSQIVNRTSTGKCGAIFRTQIEAVKMFRTRFYFVFYLAIGEDRPEQYGSPLRNLLAVY